MIELTIKTLDAKDHHFRVEDETTVGQLKEIVQEKLGLPKDIQRLIFYGKVLQDDNKLKDLDVNGKVMHLVERVPPCLQFRRAGNNTNRGVESSTNTDDSDNNTVPHRAFGNFHVASEEQIQRLLELAVPISYEDEQTLTMSPTTGRMEVIRRSIAEIKDGITQLRCHISRAGAAVAHEGTSEPPDDGPSTSFEPETEPVPGEHNDGASDPAARIAYWRQRAMRSVWARRTSPRELGSLMSQLENLNIQFARHRAAYISLLNNPTDMSDAEAASNQRIVELTCDVLHSFAHAYHAISDISCSFSRRVPVLSSEMTTTRHSPIHAQINMMQTIRPHTVTIASNVNNSAGARQSQPTSVATSSPAPHDPSTEWVGAASLSAQNAAMSQGARSSHNTATPQHAQSGQYGTVSQGAQSSQHNAARHGLQSGLDAATPQGFQSGQDAAMAQSTQSGEDVEMTQNPQSDQDIAMSQSAQSGQDAAMPQSAQSGQDVPMTQIAQSGQNTATPQRMQSGGQDAAMSQRAQPGGQDAATSQRAQTGGQNAATPQRAQSVGPNTATPQGAAALLGPITYQVEVLAPSNINVALYDHINPLPITFAPPIQTLQGQQGAGEQPNQRHVLLDIENALPGPGQAGGIGLVMSMEEFPQAALSVNNQGGLQGEGEVYLAQVPWVGQPNAQMLQNIVTAVVQQSVRTMPALLRTAVPITVPTSRLQPMTGINVVNVPTQNVTQNRIPDRAQEEPMEVDGNSGPSARSILAAAAEVAVLMSAETAPSSPSDSDATSIALSPLLMESRSPLELESTPEWVIESDTTRSDMATPQGLPSVPQDARAANQPAAERMHSGRAAGNNTTRSHQAQHQGTSQRQRVHRHVLPQNRVPAITLTSSVYDRYLHCENRHARRRLQRRREEWQHEASALQNLQAERMEAQSIGSIRQRECNLDDGEMVLLQNLLHASPSTVSWLNAFLVIVARQTFSPELIHTVAGEALFLPNEFRLVRMQLRSLAHSLLVISDNQGSTNAFDNVGQSMLTCISNFIGILISNPATVHTRIEVDINSTLLNFLRTRMPGAIMILMSDVAGQRYPPRFYTVFGRLFTDALALVRLMVLDDFGLRVIFSMFMAYLTEDADVSVSNYLRHFGHILFNEALPNVESCMDIVRMHVVVFSESVVQHRRNLFLGESQAEPRNTAGPYRPPSRQQAPRPRPASCNPQTPYQRPQPSGLQATHQRPQFSGPQASFARPQLHRHCALHPRPPPHAHRSLRRRPAHTPSMISIGTMTETLTVSDGTNTDSELMAMASTSSQSPIRTPKTPKPEHSSPSASNSTSNTQIAPSLSAVHQHWDEQWAPVFLSDQSAQREEQAPHSHAYLFESLREASEEPMHPGEIALRTAFCEHFRELMRVRAEEENDYDAEMYANIALFLEQSANPEENADETDNELYE